MNDFSFILKLHKKNYPGVELKKIPGIHSEKYNKYGILYYVSYFVKNKHGVTKIRFTSKDKKFKSIFSMDFYNPAGKVHSGLQIKDDINVEKFEKDVTKFLSDVRYKKSLIQRLKREQVDTLLNKYLYNLTESKLLGMAIPSLFLIGYYVRQYIYWQHEYTAEVSAEKEINKELFSGQRKDEAAFEEYAQLTKYIEHVIKNDAKALLLCGPPGMSKTYIVRRTLYFNGLNPGQDYIILKGSTMSLVDTYAALYKYRNKLLILDDFDSPLKNEDAINLLKSATDSYNKRIVSMPRVKKSGAGASGQTSLNIPTKFEFSGKIIIITNIKKANIDRAILSRIPALEVSFDAEQTIKMLKKMMKYMNPKIPMAMKEEVLDYILQLKKKKPSIEISFRGYQSAIEARYGVPDGWKEMVHVIVNY